MSKTIKTLAAAMALTAATSAFAGGALPAVQNKDGLYVHGFGGVNSAKVTGSINVGSTTIKAEDDYKVGFNLGGAIGYKQGPMRYEAELLYLNAKADKSKRSGVTTPANGRATGFAALANVYYDFDNLVGNDLAIVPYVGVGIGYGKLTMKTATSKISSNHFAYQGIVGVRYDINESVFATADYRYLRTAKVNNARFSAHTFNLGLGSRFNV